MNASKVVIAGTGVIAVIAALGFAYAQTSPDSKTITDSLGRDVTSSFGTPPPNTSTPRITEPTTNSVDQRQNTSADSSSSRTMDAVPTNQAGTGAVGATSGTTDNDSSAVARPTEQMSGIATSETPDVMDNRSSAASGNAVNAAGGSTGERIARADRN